MVDRLLLLALWSALVLQRLAELRLAASNTRVLRSRGAQEYGAGHYPMMVLLHSLWFLSWLIEAWSNEAGLSPHWPLFFAVCVLGQVLRWVSIITLGERWTTRVLVLPDQPPLQTGLYHWVSHPNYWGVVLELAAVPLMFQAWHTAWLFSLANAALLKIRIGVENQALGRSQ